MTGGGSLWEAEAAPGPETPPFRGPAETEVAVVGGGYTGLSAALQLAGRGVAVTLLEAQAIGWGASGRNGGQVIAGLKEEPDAIRARFGADAGGRLVRLAGAAPDLVFGLVARHGIDCGAERTGWITAAHDGAGLALCRARTWAWAREGAPVELLDARAMADRLGTDAYRGGFLDHRSGQLQPLAYARGLARAAIAAGARLHGASPARRLARAGACWQVETPGGTLAARAVLLATNAHSGPLHDGLRRSVVPVVSTQVATRPLSPNRLALILPGGQPVSDTRRLLLYFRRGPGGRLVIGGRGAFGARDLAARQEGLRRAAARLWPALGAEDWAHAWAGEVAMTADHLPHLHVLAPGLAAGLGYNGRGVAMATAMGRVLADWATGTPEAALDVPVTSLRPIPLHAFRRIGIGLAVAWAAWRDGR